MIYITFLSEDELESQIAGIAWTVKKLDGFAMSAGLWLAVSKKPFTAEEAEIAFKAHAKDVYTDLEDQAVMQADFEESKPFKPIDEQVFNLMCKVP